MYDHELVLIGESDELLYFSLPFFPAQTLWRKMDEWGNQVAVETRIPILCQVKSVSRQEFYAAAQSGLKPEIVFAVHAYEYNGERKVEFEGKKYSVVRTYRAGFEEMELVCEEVISNRGYQN